MTHPVSQGDSRTRHKLFIGKRRVEHGYYRVLADGTIVYDFLPPRAKGQKKPSFRKLDATTPTDAQHEIERLLPLTRQGKIGDRSAQLQPIYEECLAAMKSGDFKHSQGTYSSRSIELFEQRCEDHVLPALGHSAKLVDIRAAHLRAMMKRLTAQGLGGSTVRGCLSCASTLLRYAVEQKGVMEHNVASLIGRGERPSGKRRSEPRYLSIPQVEALFAKMTDDTRPIAVAMFWGALRVSEALELRWSDIGETLRVRGTKTIASDDSVPLLPKLAAELRAHRERMMKRGFDRVAPDALVFSTRSGKPVGRRNVLRAVQNAAVAAGLVGEGQQPVGCHDLRHSMIANALSIPGMSMVDASKLARHANAQVTATIYAGLADDGIAALGAKLATLG